LVVIDLTVSLTLVSMIQAFLALNLLFALSDGFLFGGGSGGCNRKLIRDTVSYSNISFRVLSAFNSVQLCSTTTTAGMSMCSKGQGRKNGNFAADG
jgi:hypothetical protein